MTDRDKPGHGISRFEVRERMMLRIRGEFTNVFNLLN